MASGFFALLDDIAVLMDDVAAMGKIATKKTAGILGDDLAVNAEKASGFMSSRELPVLWAITKGSFLNKVIILPLAFLLSAFVPWTIVPILLLGGVYLAYEGAEKIYEYIFPHAHANDNSELVEMSKEEVLAFETKKVKAAILVDFILSIEIVILALSTVVGKPLMTQILVVTFVAIVATVGVYGIVALIVRMDDFGYALLKRKNGFVKKIGSFLVSALPVVIKSLGVIGTIAMILVAGGIYHHNIHYFHDLFHAIPSILADFIIGLVLGLIALGVIKLVKRFVK